MAANDPKPIHVRVLFFGAARDAVGCDCLKIQINSAATVAGAFAQLLADYPALARFGNSLLFAVNQEYALPDRRLSDDDELAVLPPVSGGSAGILPAHSSDNDFFELNTYPIVVDSIDRRAVLPECGEPATLTGCA